jgi:hypothetical protein
MKRSYLPGKKRNRAIRADHRQKIAELRLKGTYIADIVRITCLSKSTVHRELRSLAAEWRAAAVESIDAHRHLELARLEIIERQAWLEWERSKIDYVKEVTERVKATNSDGEEFETEPKLVKRETGGRLGDPRFLQTILNAQDARRKLLGLDQPTKVAPTDPTGEKPYDPSKMTDAEIEARLAELARKLGFKPP